jgi:hypothetical protein
VAWRLLGGGKLPLSPSSGGAISPVRQRGPLCGRKAPKQPKEGCGRPIACIRRSTASWPNRPSVRGPRDDAHRSGSPLSPGLHPWTLRHPKGKWVKTEDAMIPRILVAGGTADWRGYDLELLSVVRSASTVFPAASLSQIPTLQAVLNSTSHWCNCEIAVPIQPFAPITCVIHEFTSISGQRVRLD